MDDVQEAVQLEANLNALPDSPTEEQILQAVKGFRNASVPIAMYRLLEAASGGGGVGLLTVTRHVTSGEILDLYATPVEIIPAVADKMLLVVEAVSFYTPGTTPYTTDGAIYLCLGDVSEQFIIDLSHGGLPFLFPRVVQNNADSNVPFPSAVAAGALTLGTGASAPITDGDGTLDFIIVYLLVDLP